MNFCRYLAYSFMKHSDGPSVCRRKLHFQITHIYSSRFQHICFAHWQVDLESKMNNSRRMLMYSCFFFNFFHFPYVDLDLLLGEMLCWLCRMGTTGCSYLQSHIVITDVQTLQEGITPLQFFLMSSSFSTVCISLMTFSSVSRLQRERSLGMSIQ